MSVCPTHRIIVHRANGITTVSTLAFMDQLHPGIHADGFEQLAKICCVENKAESI